ncbi:rhomboid family intramembrane serine protease [Methylobrevis albus]|uniref:Rhomboid family intramembrane serine protease n=1 Tax=Methylobrevis albus TaxID=2793297 RepID=A0A931I351_9HYPH|nr:rhomboid family intramembrane serine protease [Methylobrevis albus]MBH0238977.1 rhomboid family intramembrane serine protease [Methylobrevis albus]
MTDEPRAATGREPIFNVPGVVMALLGVLVAIHLLRVYGLSPDQNIDVLLYFSFIPARYAALSAGEAVPGGMAAGVWTFLSYGFLHASAMHLAMNVLWMVAFGGALARRFGAGRFLVFSAVAVVAGAAAHMLARPGDMVPVIGASAAVSAHMAAAARFVFLSGGPLGVFRRQGDEAFRVPALPLGETLRDRRVVVYLGIWFAVNLLAGLGAFAGPDGPSIAWEAHLGGFLVGLLLFRLFDPVPARPR